MVRCTVHLSGVLLVLLAGCGVSTVHIDPQTATEPPDTCWGTWWPTAQWSKDSVAPEARSVIAASRSWTSVQFPSVRTPWGTASPYFELSETTPPDGRRALRFALQLSTHTSADEGAAKGLQALNSDSVRMEVVYGTKVVRPESSSSVLGLEERSGWTTELVYSEFEWLPDDLEDCWIRARIGDRAVWFLLPYGFGCDPTTPLRDSSGRAGAPTPPAGLGATDEVVLWSCVYFDLGWLDTSGRVASDEPEERTERFEWAKGKTHVSATLSNRSDTVCEVTLYRDEGSFRLTNPRTTVALGIPAMDVTFSRLMSLQHQDGMRRSDTFHLDRRFEPTRTWGLLRVTVEEAAFDHAIPSSLFLFGHGEPR